MLSGVFGSFRWYVLFYGLLCGLLSWRLKSLFAGAFLTTIFCLPIFQPNKYYALEVIKPGLLSEGYEGGYFLGYGVNLVNIFLFLSGLVAIRNWILRPKLFKRSKKIWILVGPIILFLATGVIANSTYSPYSLVSNIWLLQYMQLFGVAGLCVYFWIREAESFQYVYETIAGTIFFQSTVGLWQFFRQSGIGLPAEFVRGWYFYTGLDENNALFRTSGTFVHANVLALVMAYLWPVMLLKFAKTENKFYLLATGLSLLMIALSQSRSIWLASLLVCGLTWSTYKHTWIRHFKSWTKKTWVYAGAVLSLLAFVLVPRILLSANSFYEGAGIPVRTKMLKEAVAAINLSPWVGYGVGTNEYVMYRLAPDGVISTFPSAVHMAWAQLLLEVGVVGLGMFILAFIEVLRFAVNYYHKSVKNDGLAYVFLSGIITSVVYYSFQPHTGIVEFPILGLVLGFGYINYYEGQHFQKN